ncbi:DeoR/GlpR transcriptional regulator, partial [Patescibacteria group bacterium]|nr:DeoR/GlpR transcriptional regulator [Patescibacteria group bacterium]
RSNANITVITNNLSAALEIGKPDFELILLGGSFQPRSNSVAGRFASDNLSRIYADKTFIGVDGISLKYGCTVPSNAEAEIVSLMLARTRGSITVVTDHSKWGVVSNFLIATIDEIDKLVTDEEFDRSAIESLTAHNVDSLIAAAGTEKII